MSNRPYADWYPQAAKKYPTAKELEEKYGTSMVNEVYGRTMENYMLCVSVYLSQISIPQILEKQLERRDLDTVCGYELYQMKKHFLQTDVLDYKRFHSDMQL